MNYKHLFFMFIIPLCCLSETNKPTRDYKMVDMQNGLTTTMLNIGTTSFAFSVEWSHNLEIPGDKWLYLFGKRHVDAWWNLVMCIEVDPTERKATFEIPYYRLPEEYHDYENTRFKEGFFHVSVPPPDDTGWLPSREEIEEELAKIRAEREGMVKPPPAEDESSDGIPAVESGSGFQPSGQADTTGTTAGSRRYLWLCAGIALALCAVFYFVRKKFSKTP
ncbi:MAG: hypothetical protein FWH21_08925 [Kiritimatiellaeota bacterium]|nr:hypothetical protein [Kiritimatiellota bacterium]